jgi:hypothetical protein
MIWCSWRDKLVLSRQARRRIQIEKERRRRLKRQYLEDNRWRKDPLAKKEQLSIWKRTAKGMLAAQEEFIERMFPKMLVNPPYKTAVICNIQVPNP